MKSFFASAILLLLASGKTAAQTESGNTIEWIAYGRSAGGDRYSPASQITRDNVNSLVPAWTYRTGENDIKTRRPAKLEVTPLMVDRTLYISTPLGKVAALDPITGKELWTFQADVDATTGWGDFANRGVSTWVDRTTPVTAHCHRRIFANTIDGRIFALDSRTGRKCTGFGTDGVIDLRRGLTNTPFEFAEYQLTSPPAVIRGMIVSGSSIADNNRTNAASGEVRGFDARTGRLRWTWDPVPRDSADPAWKTWGGAMGHTTGAANAWSVIAADSARDLVFVPTGSPSVDYFGGERPGDNRYANSIVALRASTGKVVWSFQAVHHDLWDYDIASPPTLATIRHGGKDVDVVLQTTKTGQLFVLDRATGKPVFDVEERSVPASTIMGERASPTQPFSSVQALSPQHFSSDSIFGLTSEDITSCREQIRPLRNEGTFTPPSLGGTLVIPSNVGGAHWGGLAYDKAHNIAVVPVNRFASMVQLIPVDQLDTADVRQNASRLGDEYTRMHGTPYVMRRRILVSPNRIPCSLPPWGALVAVDLNTGKHAWSVPLGDPSIMAPQMKAAAGPPLGLPNLGGPIITAGGLVFVGATMDRSIRAFDIETGRELWRGELPAGARATPMTYVVNGRQFVVIAAGGGEDWGRGDSIIAFALPQKK
ncbi:MAG TPA: pyrroloquinoline quinone-dependent dehydrogenase [Gemmatimonadaceae bacterium]